LRDCDGDKNNGCEIDTSTDPNNCSACGDACSLAHSTNSCSQSTCVVTACDDGWSNCDGAEANGCETNVNSDAGNCGACGKVCNGTNGVPGCSNGACAVLCNAGYGNCDGNSDTGCETSLSNNPLHCGNCGVACNPANATGATCMAGCGYVSCKPGFANCDGNNGNGCETNVSSNVQSCGGCAVACPVPPNRSERSDALRIELYGVPRADRWHRGADLHGGCVRNKLPRPDSQQVHFCLRQFADRRKQLRHVRQPVLGREAVHWRQLSVSRIIPS
jgi:hypothetical protein